MCPPMAESLRWVTHVLMSEDLLSPGDLEALGPRVAQGSRPMSPGPLTCHPDGHSR